MNARLHLLRRIHFMKQNVRSKPMLNFLEQTEAVLQADEVEITDLISRVDMIERQFNGLMPPLPDSDITLNNRPDTDAGEDDDEGKTLG
jgi:hypothetical protein